MSAEQAPTQAPTALQYSTVQHKRDKRPKPCTGGFIEFLRTQAKRVKITQAEFLAIEDSDKRDAVKDSPGVILALFDGRGRELENVTAITGSTFDIDHGHPTREQIHACVSDLQCIFHESASSTPEKPHWRLFVPYDRPVDLWTHRRAWDTIAARLDPAWLGGLRLGRDPGRINFLPLRFKDGPASPSLHEVRGETFSPVQVASDDAHETERRNYETDADARAAVLDPSTGAGMHDGLCSLAQRWANKGMPRDVIMERLGALLDDAPRVSRANEERKDLARTVDSAIAKSTYVQVDATDEFEVIAEPEQAVTMIGPFARIRDWQPRADVTTLPEPLTWFVDGWAPAGKVGTLVGRGSLGKTTLLIRLAIATALGEEWLGFPVRQGTFVLLSGEDDQRDLDEALVRMIEAGGYGKQAREQIRHHARLISLRGQVPALLTEDRGIFKPNMVVADNYQKVLGGIDDLRCISMDTLRKFTLAPSTDELAMNFALQVAERLTERLPSRPAFIFPHHVTKADARSGRVDQYAAIGSGIIVDNTRFGMAFAEVRDDERLMEKWKLTDALIEGDLFEAVITRASLTVRKANDFLINRQGWRIERLDAVRKSGDEQRDELDAKVRGLIEAGVKSANACFDQLGGKRALVLAAYKRVLAEKAGTP
jgi:hypothetical protein